jgi:hypothetical protein
MGVVVALGIAIVAGIGWAFGRQLVLSRQLRGEERRMEQLLEAERTLNEELLATLEYAQSDAYVEQWARAEARLAKPGEVVVIPPNRPDDPLAARSETPTPVPTTPEAPRFWVKWWQLVFKSQNHP